MGIIALTVLVYEQTNSALATAGLFLGTRFLPSVLAPILVTRAEKPPPRFTLPVIYCGEAATFGVLALQVNHFSLAAVIALATVDGALALTGRSLTRAVIAALLEPTGELRAGNALLNIAFTGGAAVGPAVAGLVVAGFGLETALLVDAISFYVVALILLTAGELPRAEPEPGRLRERVAAGVRYLRAQKRLRNLLIAQGAAFIFFAAVVPVEVVYAKHTLGTTDTGYGVMLASWGVGMVIGSLIFAAVRRAPLPLLLLFSTIGVALGYLGLGIAPTLAWACAASIVGGAGNGVQWVTAISAVQELTAAEMQARVMSVLESIGAAMPGVGFAVGGAITAIASPRTTFVVAGVGILVIVGLVIPLIGGRWTDRVSLLEPSSLDEGDDVVLELAAGGTPTRSNLEVRS
jgi:MFS family permease